MMSCDRYGPAAGLNCMPIVLSPCGQEGTAQVQLARDRELEIPAVWDRSLVSSSKMVECSSPIDLWRLHDKSS